jgi:ABC-type antimicrobial peptide transport system permease subunit
VQIVRLILVGVTRPVIIGAGVGLLASALTTQLIAGMLYGVRPLDPLSLIGGVTVFMTIAGLASVLPARRAASVNPADALRAD